MSAFSIRVSGVVQGVGFRPFVFRLAKANALAGWVLNGNQGVLIHVEGAHPSVDEFLRVLKTQPPPSASISALEIEPVATQGWTDFKIRQSAAGEQPNTSVSPDLPVCEDCLRELFDPEDRRYLYPYINCTNCGPRYTVILRLPYDRPNTTIAPWVLDSDCREEYCHPANRRFHAQPVACSTCGPHYFLRDETDDEVRGSSRSIEKAAQLLRAGKIVAVKGLGGYHLACDARNPDAVTLLRQRKYRKEKPFALMAKDVATAESLVDLDSDAKALMLSDARPILLAPAKIDLHEVAPDNRELGVMLPYCPLHYLLFAVDAPAVLVMTSANRSSEPIAYEDEDAFARLAGIADAFLIGERPIARRVDDSIARVGTYGTTLLRRSRGYAPGAVATLPAGRPVLAVGGDLKNTITLVVNGQAFMGQHNGDLSDYQSFRGFQDTVRDLTAMYRIDWDDLIIAHDAHPAYSSTLWAQERHACRTLAFQHHRAHVASVLAERHAWEKPVVAAAFDGTGYGDDSAIWGGEFFMGSLDGSLDRVAHLRPAALAGGDAAATCPVQAAAGFLIQLNASADFTAHPFDFPQRYRQAAALVAADVRTFRTTSVGRLFDAVAALLGFTRDVSFEGQAAMWLEQLARRGSSLDAYPFPFDGRELDFRPLLQAVIDDRLRSRPAGDIARAFQRGIARGLCDALQALSEAHNVDTVVLSGGVFQNELLCEDTRAFLQPSLLQVWTNHRVPPNDGGLSLGQAALAACSDAHVFAYLEALHADDNSPGVRTHA